MFQVFRNEFSSGMMSRGVEVVTENDTICYLSPYENDDWVLEVAFNESPLEYGELKELLEDEDLVALMCKRVE